MGGKLYSKVTSVIHEKEVFIRTNMASRNEKSPKSPTSKPTKKLNTLEAKQPAEPTNWTQALTKELVFAVSKPDSRSSLQPGNSIGY
jgi:hypothetical protein